MKKNLYYQTSNKPSFALSFIIDSIESKISQSFYNKMLELTNLYIQNEKHIKYGILRKSKSFSSNLDGMFLHV